jgi:hypothetical protein
MMRVGFILVAGALLSPVARSFEPSSNPNAFSLSAYQKARAQETSQCLDTTRFHFQILFVDNNNAHGRITEGVLARVAEYNDAMFVLFPASATLDASRNAPRDAAAPEATVAVCQSLQLCSTLSEAMGTSFSLGYLDEYDLIISMNQEVQDTILRSLSLESQLSYGPKCRLLSEFLSTDFCDIHKKGGGDHGNRLLDMLDSDLRERVEPYLDLVKDCSSSNIIPSSTITWEDIYAPRMVLTDTGAAVINTQGWQPTEAAIILASAGLTRFCLDTMDFQTELAFQSLLERHFCRKEHLEYSFDQADDQLREGSFAVTGYFSPQQRRTRFEEHTRNLRLRLEDSKST